MTRTAVLAYSGGLDTSCAIAWLREDYGFDKVVAVYVDVGQQGDVEVARARGAAAGAEDIVVVDRRYEFAADQVAKAIKTNALYEGKYPLVSALSRPVIAEAVALVAQELDAEAVVHGCTGKGNDQIRFELAFKATYPGVRVIAPLRDEVRTREEEIEYALERGIAVDVTRQNPYSIDENLMGRTVEAGVLEDPWAAAPEDAFELTAPPADAPEPSEIVISFAEGLPTAVDGIDAGLVELIADLNIRVGAYGFGRVDMIENRAIGIKSRELYEVPALLALIEAHRALEDLTLTRSELQLKRHLEDRWATCVYDGLWFHPLRTSIDAFVDATQKVVTGDVRLELSPGSATVNGRRSENALYAETLASYGAGETFPHQAAEGAVTVASLETELLAARARKRAKV